MPTDLPAPPRSRRTLWITLAVIAVSIAASLYYHWQKWAAWEAEWKRVGIIEPHGGVFQQPRLELNVPLFRQSDQRWHSEKLGAGPDTMGSAGCAVSSAAMVLASYGLDTDPGRLNRLLSENDGYENGDKIRWEKAAEVTGNAAEKAYEDLPSHELIDRNLQAGNPVIVRLKREGQRTHFVVIAGKDGYEYLTRDPGAGAEKGLYPLREYGSKIEALRFYRRLK
jgi:Peptidase_C39 like family